MSVSSSVGSSGQSSPVLVADRRWMIGPWVDCLFILLTPLLAAPAVLFLSSESIGVRATTISLVVASFFALGHHLPGLIRAYGDSELFRRFRWRFVLVPPLVFLGYFPLYTYHFELLRLIIRVWATWHGLMQLYGFVRIYDSKVGSTSRVTANLDWLVCLCGFVVPQLFRPVLFSQMLGYWRAVGGPLVPVGAFGVICEVSLAISLVVLCAFVVNYVVCYRNGPRPNPLKLLMLISGIGSWSLAILFVDELILAVALFDICHDVQYNAIVWMYNCRLVKSGAKAGSSFLKYLFRRGMVLLYVGLIAAYGALGMIAPFVENAAISRLFYGVIFTSTILHYYYDGFIWKVRESSNQVNLGVGDGSGVLRRVSQGHYTHLLKWSPAVLVLGVLFASDLLRPPLTTARKNEMEQTYVETLVGKPALPADEAEKSWLYSRFRIIQDIASVVPGDRGAQLRAAVMLANFGRNDEAVVKLEELLRQHPGYRDANVAVGDIYFYRGSLDEAAVRYQLAREQARDSTDRSVMSMRLGEIALREEDFAGAKARFDEALVDDPELAATIKAIRNATASVPES